MKSSIRKSQLKRPYKKPKKIGLCMWGDTKLCVPEHEMTREVEVKLGYIGYHSNCKHCGEPTVTVFEDGEKSDREWIDICEEYSENLRKEFRARIQADERYNAEKKRIIIEEKKDNKIIKPKKSSNSMNWLGLMIVLIGLGFQILLLVLLVIVNQWEARLFLSLALLLLTITNILFSRDVIKAIKEDM